MLFVQLAILLVTLAQGNPVPSQDASVKSFIDFQADQSLNRLLKNINPAGTESGIIVAAQSKTNPNYWYHWTRDSALTMNTIVSLYSSSLAANDGAGAAKYEKLLWAYVNREQSHRLQPTISKSLGEPKWEVVSY